MSRLFTFGCSFTNYRWSSWADCLAPEFDYFENWGQAGGGNHYIIALRDARPQCPVGACAAEISGK